MNADNGITFRKDFGEWWPNYDHKPEKCFGFVRHGLADMDIAAGLCRERRVCVQAGAHAGLWPRRLAGIFGQVFAFEPDAPLYECATRNLTAVTNVVLTRAALGERAGAALLQRRSSAGSSRIDPDQGDRVAMVTIDGLELAACDAIFLDVEGYEVEALRGAAKTIEKFSPILHLEELPRAADAIRMLMAELGYRLHRRIHKDAVYERR